MDMHLCFSSISVFREVACFAYCLVLCDVHTNMYILFFLSKLIFQEVLRPPPPTCHQLPQESLRAHLKHPSQEEAEVVAEPSGHLDDTAAALSLKTKMLRNHESACFRERKAGFRMAGGWLVLLLASSAAAFYLPGLAPVTYCTTKVQIAFYASLF